MSAPVLQRGNADQRTIMGGDRLDHSNAGTYPWIASGATPLAIDISVGMGGSANGALTRDFAFSHIVVSNDTAGAFTVSIEYRVPGGNSTKTITHYMPKGANGVTVLPIGLLFPQGATNCQVKATGHAGNATLQLCGVQ